MNTIKNNIFKGIFLGSAIIVASSCTKDPNSPGVEYTPDMYRSPAIETYVDYGVVQGKEQEELTKKQSAMKPPKGTIPYQGMNKEKVMVMMPYPYAAPLNSNETHGLYNMEQDGDAYQKSAAMKNPIPYSEGVLEEGKEVYENFCIHCHGENGEGNGKISENGHILGIPSYKDKLKDLSEGQIFYSITYGKGLMGAHASLIDKEERWKVTHYVKLLQNGGEYPVEGSESVSDSTITASDTTTVAMEQSPEMDSNETEEETE